MMNFWFDLKYAWRLLKKSWGYSLMCASVVALSVGLAVWTNALTYSMVFKPLPFPGSSRWYSVQLISDATGRPRPAVDAYTWQELLAHNRAAQYLGAFSSRSAVLSEGESTTTLRAAAIAPALLAATQVPPLLGRTFRAADAQPGAAAVAILSFDTWQSYFAGDPAIIGKTARIDAGPVQIVGVMPHEFLAFDDYELWTPLQLPVLARPHDSTMTLFPLIVPGGDQSVESIERELNATITRVNG
ncbi:MAG TPA: ABC transporter permease, partial [Thermoanaerobaculia bacterium]